MGKAAITFVAHWRLPSPLLDPRMYWWKPIPSQRHDSPTKAFAYGNTRDRHGIKSGRPGNSRYRSLGPRDDGSCCDRLVSLDSCNYLIRPGHDKYIYTAFIYLGHVFGMSRTFIGCYCQIRANSTISQVLILGSSNWMPYMEHAFLAVGSIIHCSNHLHLNTSSSIFKSFGCAFV